MHSYSVMKITGRSDNVLVDQISLEHAISRLNSMTQFKCTIHSDQSIETDALKKGSSQVQSLIGVKYPHTHTLSNFRIDTMNGDKYLFADCDSKLCDGLKIASQYVGFESIDTSSTLLNIVDFYNFPIIEG